MTDTQPECFHSAPANQKECFRTFVGNQIKGILFDGFGEKGSKAIIFECGWGLIIEANGTYWIEAPERVSEAIQNAADDLKQAQAEIAGLLPPKKQRRKKRAK